MRCRKAAGKDESPMQTFKKNWKKKAAALAGFCLAVLALLFVYTSLRPGTSAGRKQVTVEVVYSDGSSETYRASTDALYLEQAMADMEGLTVEGNRTEAFGLMVLTVNGVTADYETDGAYWAIYLEDQPCSYGVSTQPGRGRPALPSGIPAGRRPGGMSRHLALGGILAALLFAAQAALAFLPNIELVSLLVILYTLFLGKRVVPVLLVFALLEGLLYGFGLWWVSYLYVWPLLAGLAALLKRAGASPLCLRHAVRRLRPFLRPAVRHPLSGRRPGSRAGLVDRRHSPLTWSTAPAIWCWPWCCLRRCTGFFPLSCLGYSHKLRT